VVHSGKDKGSLSSTLGGKKKAGTISGYVSPRRRKVHMMLQLARIQEREIPIVCEERRIQPNRPTEKGGRKVGRMT